MNAAAVITAGARVDGEFAETIGTPVKALASVGGLTLLDRTIAAARGAGLERIAVVGGPEVRRSCAHAVDRVIEESKDGAENVRRALHAWEDGPLVYLTSDMPFISGKALRDFLDRVPSATIAMPLTACETFERCYPGAPSFGARVGRERVVNGGAFVLPRESIAAVESLAVRFFDARKSLWRMATLLGLPLLVRFAMGRLNIEDLEHEAYERTGFAARAIRDAPAELAYDIDTLLEYRYAAARR